MAKSEFDSLFLSSASNKPKSESLFDMVNVELIDKCIRSLKLGKACGPDELSAEHLVHAHPSLVIHICFLFRSVILHGFVPDNFGVGLIVPLVKDKTGDINNVSNYRGITLIAVISKLFEGVLLEICNVFLQSDHLQFGFKKGLGCSDAIFSLRTAIDYFRERDNTVYDSAVDISKAFDNVNHYKLYTSLLKAGFPGWVVGLLVNWYGKLSVAVHWQGSLSDSFIVQSGVRQGSSLSPAIFYIFINTFIVKLRETNSGCCINGDFVGCIMYADVLILISASVNGLQTLLNCCHTVSLDF